MLCPMSIVKLDILFQVSLDKEKSPDVDVVTRSITVSSVRATVFPA